MRRSGRLFIALGAGLAVVAVGLILVVLLSGGDGDEVDPNATEAPEAVREITVLVAARDIPAHTILTAEDLEEEIVQSDTVPPDAMRNPVEAVGFAYSVDLFAGQVLVESNRELPGLANRIDPGRRAFPLLVDGANLVAGQIRDDDHIDIIFSTRMSLTRISPTYPFELPDNLELQDAPGESIEGGEGRPPGVSLPEYGNGPEGPVYPYPGEPGSRFWLSDTMDGEPIGKLIMQNVRVLRVIAASASEANPQVEGNYLILDLDPVESELMEYLTEVGSFQILLRSPEDEELVETPGTTMNMLVDNWGLIVPRTVRLPEAGAQ
ncbi:hypothetical protein BH23CHL2_BH23CHL2_20300 [soil metagenome]